MFSIQIPIPLLKWKKGIILQMRLELLNWEVHYNLLLLFNRNDHMTHFSYFALMSLTPLVENTKTCLEYERNNVLQHFEQNSSLNQTM